MSVHRSDLHGRVAENLGASLDALEDHAASPCVRPVLYSSLGQDRDIGTEENTLAHRGMAIDLASPGNLAVAADADVMCARAEGAEHDMPSQLDIAGQLGQRTDDGTCTYTHIVTDQSGGMNQRGELGTALFEQSGVVSLTLRIADGTQKDVTLFGVILLRRAYDRRAVIEAIQNVRTAIKKSFDSPWCACRDGLTRPDMDFAAEASGVDDDESGYLH